jgi:hypothetical protein
MGFISPLYSSKTNQNPESRLRFPRILHRFGEFKRGDLDSLRRKMPIDGDMIRELSSSVPANYDYL